MAKNTDVLPFTELVERTRELARADAENDLGRSRGAVNDIYARKMPSEEDWTFLLVDSAITCQAPYTTGNVSVNTQDSVVGFFGGAVADTGYLALKIKFADNGNIYDLVGFTNSTTMTISPLLSGDVNVINGAYTIFQPYYALASDFDRFPKNGGLLFYQGGRITQIPEEREGNFYTNYTPSPNSVPRACRAVTIGTDGLQRVEITPPPQKAYNLPYQYLKRPTIMREVTGGTVTISGGATIVTFHGGARLGEMTTGMYLRVDAYGKAADSEWYRLINLASATSTGTLQTAFSVSAAISAAFTVCHAPEYPIKLQPAIMHGGVMMVTADQNDPLFQFYQGSYREAMTEAKKTFKTRIYNQEVETVLEDWQYRR